MFAFPKKRLTRMKKLFLLGSISLLFWTCSTEIDVLDDWKETAGVYGLLDQSQPKQYIRIQKAFLGPDNALTMAQEYDSINYINQLSVYIQQMDQNGNVLYTYALQPDTFTKEPGFFNSAQQVVYSMNTQSTFNTNHRYKLLINNSQTGNSVDATTSLLDAFTVSQPTGPSINMVKITATTVVRVVWNTSPDARIYQVGMKFFYWETDLNGTEYKATPEWTLGTVQTTANSSSTQEIVFEPDNFYRFVADAIPYDPDVISRRADTIKFVIYAAGPELQTYMEVNGPSSALVQEKPFYTNINNGLGVFSSRYATTPKRLILTGRSVDSLACGRFTNQLRFEDSNSQVGNCQ